MTVLILTCEQDVTADLVVAQLNRTGVPVVRLDPADLPGAVALSGEYVHGSFRGHLSAGGRLVSMSGLRSVWVRRPGVPAAAGRRAVRLAHRGVLAGAVRHAAGHAARAG